MGCDGRYARSKQGLCKIGQILFGFIIWIIIACSPYWKPIFLIEGVTWPFHLVMLFVFLPWLGTIVMYFVFLSGYHFNFGHINWPKSELIFNLLCLLSYLVAGVLESVHLWRWDYTNGSPINYSGPIRNQNRYGSAMYGGRSGYGGYQRGMGLNARMNFQAYCGRYPRDCQNYMAMLAGYNVYFGNHIFAVVFLWIVFCLYLASTLFAWKMFKDFQKKYWKPGTVDDRPSMIPSDSWHKPDPGPSMWKVTAGKLKSGINGLEHKMKSLVRRDDVTEPSDIGDFIPSKTPLSRNDQIVSLQHVRPPSHDVEGFRIVEDAPRKSSRRTQDKEYHESREYREPRSPPDHNSVNSSVPRPGLDDQARVSMLV